MAIELSKTRDFGEIISDSFMFIRENFKPLLKCFFIFCGFFMAAMAVSSYLQQTKMYGSMNSMITDPNNFDSPAGPFAAFSKLFGVEYLLIFFFAFMNSVVSVITVIGYMAIYKAKGNQPATPEEVWGYLKYYFLNTAGCTILVAILIALGFICCIIPAIWLYPILSLIFPIMIVENTGFGYAWSQSFRLIKDNWWTTFGAMIVAAIIFYILTVVIVLPFSVASMGSVFLHPGKGIHVSPVLTFFSTVLTALCHVFYILPLVTLTICYFSLNERTEATGLMERINMLGGDAANTNSTPEEY